jgi:hypothetical protein
MAPGTHVFGAFLLSSPPCIIRALSKAVHLEQIEEYAW